MSVIPRPSQQYHIRSDGARDKLFKKDGLQVPDSAAGNFITLCALGMFEGFTGDPAFKGDYGLDGVFPKGQLGRGSQTQTSSWGYDPLAFPCEIQMY